MVGGHHQLNGCESEQTLGDSEGQASLACCSPWGHKELDTTERLNSNKWYCFSDVSALSGAVPSWFMKFGVLLELSPSSNSFIY